MAWSPEVGGSHARELERYRAFVVASSLLDAPEPPKALTDKLFAIDDEQVRAYASWLATDATASPHAQAYPNGAALARHHGHEDLARTLETQGARLAAGFGTLPHRT